MNEQMTVDKEELGSMGELSSPEQAGLMKLLKPHRPSRNQFIVMALLVIITTALELFIPLFSKHMVDSIGTPGLDYTLVLMLIGIVLAAAIAEGVLAWYGSYLGEKTNFRLRFSVFKHLLHTEQESLNNEHSAELSARVVNDSMAVKSVLAEDLIGFVTGLVSIVAVITIMFVLDWRLTLVLVSCIFLGVVLITPLAVSMRGIGQSMQEAEAKLIANVTEWLRSATTIKVHNASSPVLKLGQQLLQNAYFHAMRQARVMALIGPISNLILMVSMIAILASSAVWLADGSLTLGTVTAFLIYLFGLAFPIMAIGMFLSNVHRASGAAIRLNQLLGLPTEQTKTGMSIEAIEQLKVNGLTYENTGKRILDNIHWQFKPNTLTVLTGESGSGKSTLVQQLVGLYASTLENIAVNDIPLSNIQLDSLRHHIAWVEQSPSLFMGTVRDNLCLGLDNMPTEEELINAINKVGLSTWFEKNNRNLDLVLTEKMQQLSGGERQRLALARAVLRKPSLLILDEPTSALDKQTEADIMNTIRAIANDTMVLLITHNSSLICDNDDVINMDSGRLSVGEPIPA